jgi:hypothetical protein
MTLESSGFRPETSPKVRDREKYEGLFAVVLAKAKKNGKTKEVKGDDRGPAPGTICSIYDHNKGTLFLRSLRKLANLDQPSCVTEMGCPHCLKDCQHRIYPVRHGRVETYPTWEEAARAARRIKRGK